MNGYILWLVRAALFFAIVSLSFHMIPDYMEFDKNIEFLISLGVFTSISYLMYKGGMLR